MGALTFLIEENKHNWNHFYILKHIIKTYDTSETYMTPLWALHSAPEQGQYLPDPAYTEDLI